VIPAQAVSTRWLGAPVPARCGRRGSRRHDAPGQRGSPCPSRVRTIGALTVTRNAQPSGRPGPFLPAAIRRRQRAGQ
jgi:hypothetical protein